MLIGLESAGVFRFLFLYLRPFLGKASVLLGLGVMVSVVGRVLIFKELLSDIKTLGMVIFLFVYLHPLFDKAIVLGG